MRTLEMTEYHLEDRARRIQRLSRKESGRIWATLLGIVFFAGCLFCGLIALALLRLGGCL